MAKRVLQLLFPFLCYAVPLLFVYIAMKLEIRDYWKVGHHPDKCDKEEKDIKRTFKKIALGVCMSVCATRVTIGEFEPLDYIAIYLWLFWSIYKLVYKRKEC